MSRYEFRIVLKNDVNLTEEIANDLFASGCDDGTPGTTSGVFAIDFHREAESLEAAIRSAIADVASTGHTVDRVEIEATSMPQAVGG